MTVTPTTNGSNFFSSGLRQKVDQLMNILYAGGVNNPMDSIEQISYLLFLRLLTEKDETLATLDKKYTRVFSGKWARFAWGNFVTLTGDDLFNAVRDAIESLHELPGLTETGKLLFNRATLKIYDRPTLRAVIQGIHDFDLAAHDGHDFKGDMYEYLLSKLSASGTNGQFRTPRHIIDLITTLVNPQPGQNICDPACGTAGFLISAFNYVLRQNTKAADIKRGLVDGALLKPAQWKFLEEQAFTGFDNDANMVKIAILNLYLHQLEKARISIMNPLTTGFGGAYPGKMFDVILANPPFAGKVQDESILADLNYKLNTRATELLFLKWFIDHLAPNGRAGVIVPNGVLFAGTNASKALRELLLTECDLQAVISLPSGVFKPYAGVATAVLVFQKGGPTRSVWFYDITADGFSLDDKRTPIAANDIPDVLANWPNRVEGTNSYRVPLEKIQENDWSLAAGRYKPVITEAAIHDAPESILKDVLGIENEIIQHSNALLAQISKKNEGLADKTAGEVCEFIRGITFKPTDIVDAASPIALACFRTKNVQVSLEADDLIYIPRSIVQGDRQLVREGDVLISTANSNNLVGKCCYVPHLNYSATLGGFIAGVRANPKYLQPRFLYYWLSSPPTQKRLRGLARQTTNISNLPLTDVAKEPVFVPPLLEQARMVKLMDEADGLRKLRTKADRRTATLISALFHEMFGQRIAGPPVVTSTVDLKAPREWRWAKLTDVARLATGHTPSRRHPEWWGGDIPWISLTDIRELDGTIAAATSEHVNEEGIEHSSSVKLPQGTVCFSRTASVGFVTVMGREMATSQDFVNWVCGPELDPIFLMGALIQAREHLRSLASGSTHKTIYFPTVKQFATIVPPLALQKEFAVRATEIRALQAEQDASRRRLEELFQSLLHGAFSGEL